MDGFASKFLILYCSFTYLKFYLYLPSIINKTQSVLCPNFDIILQTLGSQNFT